ncbi:hypothetical protein Pfo_016722 [Paulownia fortunei]|nr:hypothetical protein Pfo_016722 [Paulownia fortunei]
MEKYIQAMADHWLKLLFCLLVVMMNTQVHGFYNVNITYLTSAVQKGAVCMDGSPPGYYYAEGSGDGVNNWVIYLQGGGWCGSDESCGARLTQETGSIKYKNQTIYFGQIRSENKTQNPDFYNWNRVYVAYCDSSSYEGDVEEIDPNTNIARRGSWIFYTVMEDLLAKGMANATNALLSGGSAGGLATILHCDGFRELLPNASRVKCVSDSGFFVHAPNLHGAQQRADYFAAVVAYHGITKHLPQSCTSRMNASLCIFPEYIVRDIQTPLFLVETAFDEYQLQNHFVSDEPNWQNCTKDFSLCTPSHFQSMKDYGVAVRGLLQDIRNSSSIGMFVHSCYRHGHFYEKLGWGASYVLGNRTIQQAVGDWFFDRNSFQEIDIDNELPLRRNYTKLNLWDL